MLFIRVILAVFVFYLHSSHAVASTNDGAINDKLQVSLEKLGVHFDTPRQIQVFFGNQPAYESKISLVERAQKSIDLAYYIYADDWSSSFFTTQLLEKAKSGVRVRLLVDATMAMPYHDFFKMLLWKQEREFRTPNFKISYFRPMASEVTDDLSSWGFTTRADQLELARRIGLFDWKAVREFVDEKNPFFKRSAPFSQMLQSLFSILAPCAAYPAFLERDLERFVREPMGDALSLLLDARLRLLRKVKESGAQFSELTFRPEAWLLSSKRLHHKLLLVDNFYLQGGGRNIEDSYHWEKDNPLRHLKHPLGHPAKYIFMDVDFQVPSKELAEKARETFETFWTGKSQIRIEEVKLDDRDKKEKSRHELFARLEKEMIERAALFEKYRTVVPKEPPIQQGGLLSRRSTVAYIENNMFRDPKNPSRYLYEQPSRYHQVWRLLIDRLGKNETLLLHNAYFYLPGDLQMAVSRAIERGVKVTVMTNSRKSSDLGFMAPLARFQYRELLKIGENKRNEVEIFEYLTEESLHAKVSAIGDALVVGSANADPRSRYLDTNNGVLILPALQRSTSLAERYRKWLEQVRERLMQKGPDGSVRMQKLDLTALLEKDEHKDIVLSDRLKQLLSQITEWSFENSPRGEKARHFLDMLFLQL